MNSVSIIGRLVKDVEVKEVGGKAKADFTLAVKRPTKNNETDFIDVQLWDKQANILGDYCSKGSQIGIEGSIRKDTWKKGEETCSRVYIVGHRLTLLAQGGDKPSSYNNDYD